MPTERIDEIYLHEIIGTPSAGQSGFSFIVTQANRDDDANRTAAWHCDPASNLRRITDPALGATAVLHHPEAPRLAFLRAAGSGVALHLIDLDGGEARQLAMVGDTITSLLDWDASAGKLLVTAEVRERDDQAPAIVESLPYKLDGLGIVVGKRIGLAEVDEATGDFRWLVDTPGDVREARWSPDRSQLAWVQDSCGAERQRMGLWVRSADGQARQLANDLVSMRELAWSPDGRQLAVGGNAVEGASQSFLHVVDLDSGQARALGEIELAIPGCVTWRDDGILALDAWRGLQRVIRIDPGSGERDVLFTPSAGHVMSFASGRGGLACVVADASSGPALWLAASDGADAREVGEFNAWRRQRPRVVPAPRRFQVPDGRGGSEQVEGWLLHPEGDGPWPLLLDMHGGPQSHVTFDLETHIHWPLLVSRGWAVLALNSVGSDSYGREFAERLCGHWGEYDLPQYAAAVEALRSEGLVDGVVAAFGHSYGGFLGGWALVEGMPLTAAVLSAGVLDQRSHTGTSDTGYYVGAYAMGGDYPVAADNYERLSVARRAHEITVPTLLLQGVEDERCPVGQAEQMYTQMLRAGKARVRMVLFPGGSHHVSSTGRPSHRETWYGQLVDWLEEHRQGAGAG
jgi:dipeptidyl aminopeptidase/acylaminoacyl peptidase